MGDFSLGDPSEDYSLLTVQQQEHLQLDVADWCIIINVVNLQASGKTLRLSDYLSDICSLKNVTMTQK